MNPFIVDQYVDLLVLRKYMFSTFTVDEGPVPIPALEIADDSPRLPFHVQYGTSYDEAVLRPIEDEMKTGLYRVVFGR